MKKKIVLVTMATLFLSLLIVGVASAKGWLNVSDTWEYHVSADHKIMVRWTIPLADEYPNIYTDQYYVAGYNPERCGDDAVSVWGYDGFVTLIIFELAFDWPNGITVCHYPHGYFDSN